jgi:hypothetical protein
VIGFCYECNPQPNLKKLALRFVSRKRPIGIKYPFAIGLPARALLQARLGLRRSITQPALQYRCTDILSTFFWNGNTNNWYFITQKRWYFVTHSHISFSNYLKFDEMLQLSDLAFFLLILFKFVIFSKLIPS